MSPIKPLHWFIASLLAISGVFIWIIVALPRFQIIDVSVNREQAMSIADSYLKQEFAINTDGYQRAIIFSMDDGADRYLQKNLGVAGSKEFIKKYDVDLFYWKVRFFKENQKEEFKVIVSSKTGQVISFTHFIDEAARLPFAEADEARESAVHFISNNKVSFPQQYVLHASNVEKKENRVDYLLSWEDKGVDIPWDLQHQGGKAKLLMFVGISGQSVLYFNKNQLTIPDGFNRSIDKLKQTGENLMLVSQVLYLILLTAAIMLLVNRRRYVVPGVVKRFYISLGVAIFLSIVFFDILNSYQHYFFGYSTTQSLSEYMFRSLVGGCLGIFFTALVFILPGLSGESLRYENSPQEKSQGFLSSILSSFFSVTVSRQIWMGYLMAPILLAIQAILFGLGYKYWGVWDELSWLANSSTAIVPALSAFVFGFQAAITEEILFRLFAIHLFKRLGLNNWGAVLISALMWGMGHTGYEVFPMWFRGLEVTCLGIILGFVYLRFGLVTVIVIHFLIDAFRASLQYLINPHLSFDFISCLFILGLPFIFSWVALKFNHSDIERPWRDIFSPQQQFNYQLLKEICALKSKDQLETLKKELVLHGWDPVIINRVFQERSSDERAL
ncbi:MAG: CPBP family intramembrane metalloprotease [Candidatus Omnitrophica bacterium]|nr:CPBP family intramembrane metalloprotease [Candidatus Omnitrophota bacterium]